ncbi:MAG: acetyl-CoA C-acetyltransferase [Betaproteobacteria bacterium]|nr:MAG: acetyl-CoA C-acetyltransferase [Betaproteobacteria bacterium]
MADRDAYIVSACRTAIGEFLGGLASVTAPELGAIAIREAVSRAGIQPGDVEEVLMGNVVQAGVGQAPARQALIKAGIPNTVGATTVNKVCGSGLKAVMLAAQSIKAGDQDIVVAGGMESMSNAPYYLPKARTGYRLGNGELVDGVILDGLWDSFNNFHMGSAAELIARKFKVTREDQDRFSVESHQKAVRAQKEGKFKDEIVPVMIPQRKGDPLAFAADEFIKTGTTLESISGLRPAFAKDGSVTAANASGINDGAAGVVVMSAERAAKLGLKPMAKIKAFASSGVDPSIMGMGPVSASRRCLEKAGWKPADLDLMEINEAFAAQACAVNKEMGWDTSKINVNGGAIALGHPIGASGCRVLVTLLYGMARRDAKKGLASLCIGGGMGVAMAVER